MKRILLFPILLTPAIAADAPLPARVEFNRDVRPILADTCFRCHGFDKATRKADLRLDVREAALAEHDGVRAIVPGKPEESAIWKHITSTDEDEVMPPPKAARQLTAREKAVLKKWLEQGAEYQAHFAYIPPVKSAVPRPEMGPWKSSTNPVDAFVRARHVELGLQPAAEADRATLVRRLYFDLLGLPPKPEEVDAFVNDTAPDAYAKLVERLLGSEHHGERMAAWWLDLVRFADTIGYHSDNPKNVWPYRDYVIRAFNQNKRFDKFTIEQLAGDLLPDATQETRVASAYNRLILSTEEGGAQPKQYEAKYLVDRVKSIGTTWLAQTFMCAECHDHKFDPVTTRDFYSLGAFFADINEPAVGRPEPGMTVTTPEQDAKLKELTEQHAALVKKLETPDAARDAAQEEWEKSIANVGDVPWAMLKPASAIAEMGSKIAIRDDQTMKVEAAGNPDADIYKISVHLPAGTTGIRLETLTSSSLPASGPGRAGNGNFVVNEFTVEADGKPLKIAGATATFEQPKFVIKDAIDGKRDNNKGWGILGNAGRDNAAYFELAATVEKETDASITIRQTHGTNHTIGKFRLSATTAARPIRVPNSTMPAEIVALLKIAPAERKPEQSKKIADHHRSIAPELAPLRADIAKAEKERADFDKSLPRVLTANTTAKRTVRILPRGDWQNESGEIVLPATPKFLPGATESTAEKRLTRLDLARWLVARENPLTARVFMNRLWKQFFGIGLSKSLEDMGTQSEIPANAALLDWIAVEFMDSGWDVRAMVRMLVMSNAYRQSSMSPKDVVARDPQNREIARQSRWRLDAEAVRDNALSIAGLMVHKIGGPSVKPYQPAGYWENLNFPTREWENDKNQDQWRRGLYTWWQRSYVHPAMLAFDAPTREECSADRVRSNIPQQALVLLNDPQFVEAARSLALRMQKDGGSTPESRIAWAWKTATGRAALPDEISILAALLEKHLAKFQSDEKAADALLSVGYSKPEGPIEKASAAAYTSVARTILNLHETITRM